MTRAIDTMWVAKNDDQAIPPRVKLRVFAAAGGRCEECTNLIVGKLRPEYDHKVALINGGAHAEHNLQLLCMSATRLKRALMWLRSPLWPVREPRPRGSRSPGLSEAGAALTEV